MQGSENKNVTQTQAGMALEKLMLYISTVFSYSASGINRKIAHVYAPIVSVKRLRSGATRLRMMSPIQIAGAQVRFLIWGGPSFPRMISTYGKLLLCDLGLYVELKYSSYFWNSLWMNSLHENTIMEWFKIKDKQ